MALVKPEVYDELYRDEQFAKYECLLELGVVFKGTVLDVGCGTALLYEFLRAKRAQFNYICLEPDPGMLEIATGKLNSPLVIAVEAYAENLPIRSGAVNVLVSVSTWGLLEKSPGVLGEFKEPVKRGGVVVVTGHPKTYKRSPADYDPGFHYVKNCIDDVYLAVT